MKLMTVDEAKEVCRDCSVWRYVLSDYPAIENDVLLNTYFTVKNADLLQTIIHLL